MPVLKVHAALVDRRSPPSTLWFCSLFGWLGSSMFPYLRVSPGEQSPGSSRLVASHALASKVDVRQSDLQAKLNYDRLDIL